MTNPARQIEWSVKPFHDGGKLLFWTVHAKMNLKTTTRDFPHTATIKEIKPVLLEMQRDLLRYFEDRHTHNRWTPAQWR